ncbi:MAG: thiolase family protein [Planctomycetota bacterium]|nr:MAG: thiolase family protein [Planctomycetota bacterium]
MNERLAILAGIRTPQAKAFGALADVPAVALGRHAVTALMERVGLPSEQVEEVVFGNVAGPPDAANIARVITLMAGLPQSTIAHTVNRNCGSGMEAIAAAWQAILTGRSKLAIAGGVESMSNIPMLLSRSLQGKLMAAARAKTYWQKLRAWAAMRPRDFKPMHGLRLGLTDPVCGLNMGETAEVLAAEFDISRQDQDQFALDSHRRAVAAQQACFLSGEIAPIDVGGKPIEADIGPRSGQTLEQLAALRPIFRAAHPDRQPTITAGNSCGITDGATALLVAAESTAAQLGIAPLAYVRRVAVAGCDPRRMGLGPVFAMAKLLRETGMEISDFDLFEINEAFAAQVLACLAAMDSDAFAQQYLDRPHRLGAVDRQRLNVHGGAIALGHPVGASGARIVLTLARALRQQGGGIGIASLCIGGGQGMAMLVETQ